MAPRPNAPPPPPPAAKQLSGTKPAIHNNGHAQSSNFRAAVMADIRKGAKLKHLDASQIHDRSLVADIVVGKVLPSPVDSPTCQASKLQNSSNLPASVPKTSQPLPGSKTATSGRQSLAGNFKQEDSSKRVCYDVKGSGLRHPALQQRPPSAPLARSRALSPGPGPFFASEHTHAQRPFSATETIKLSRSPSPSPADYKPIMALYPHATKLLQSRTQTSLENISSTSNRQQQNAVPVSPTDKKIKKQAPSAPAKTGNLAASQKPSTSPSPNTLTNNRQLVYETGFNTNTSEMARNFRSRSVAPRPLLKNNSPEKNEKPGFLTTNSVVHKSGTDSPATTWTYSESHIKLEISANSPPKPKDPRAAESINSGAPGPRFKFGTSGVARNYNPPTSGLKIHAPLPPVRQSSLSPGANTVTAVITRVDFEAKFTFRPVQELPKPYGFTGIRKTYPSNQVIRRNDRPIS